jgi:hypothetical protein
MVSRWIEFVKAYAKKHGCSYKEAMSKSKASYKPVKKGGAVGTCGHGVNPIGLERTIGGAKMPLPQLKKEVKSLGHKLSRVVDGVRKAYNKKELLQMMPNAMDGGKFSLSQLARDAGRISKKILKVGVPAAVGIGTVVETGNPAAALAAAKGSSELTNYVLGAGKRRKKKV